MYRSVTIVSV